MLEFFVSHTSNKVDPLMCRGLFFIQQNQHLKMETIRSWCVINLLLIICVPTFRKRLGEFDLKMFFILTIYKSLKLFLLKNFESAKTFNQKVYEKKPYGETFNKNA